MSDINMVDEGVSYSRGPNGNSLEITLKNSHAGGRISGDFVFAYLVEDSEAEHGVRPEIITGTCSVYITAKNGLQAFFSQPGFSGRCQITGGGKHANLGQAWFTDGAMPIIKRQQWAIHDPDTEWPGHTDPALAPEPPPVVIPPGAIIIGGSKR